MNNSTTRKFLLGMHDFSCEEQNKADKLAPPSFTSQPSLSMGPKIIFANAIGDPEAVAIVNEWRPNFGVTIVDKLPEDSNWEL
jgi:hypothetical protein